LIQLNQQTLRADLAGAQLKAVGDQVEGDHDALGEQPAVELLPALNVGAVGGHEGRHTGLDSRCSVLAGASAPEGIKAGSGHVGVSLSS
jgi:hypothetical protein